MIIWQTDGDLLQLLALQLALATIQLAFSRGQLERK
jgi:hypothetical protein